MTISIILKVWGVILVLIALVAIKNYRNSTREYHKETGYRDRYTSPKL